MSGNEGIGMAIEKGGSLGEWIRGLASLEVYKRSQGRVVRQVTFAALACVVAAGAWRLSGQLIASGPTLRVVLPAAALAGGLWFCFRAVNVAPFADFLIAVEAEMAKVSWPDRGTVIRSSIVVLFTIFALAVLLFAYDLALMALLKAIGIGK
jgi:preprotein translocase subunit SecE